MDFVRTWLKMQSNVNKPLHLDKRKTCGRQYDMLPSSDVGMWTQLHEQIRVKILSKQMTKTGNTQKLKTTIDTVELKDKRNGGKGSVIEADQAEQLDALLNQSAKVLNKNHDTEEMDSSTTSKRNNRSLFPFIIKILRHGNHWEKAYWFGNFWMTLRIE